MDKQAVSICLNRLESKVDVLCERVDALCEIVEHLKMSLRPGSSMQSLLSRTPSPPRGLLNLNPVHDLRLERQRRFESNMEDRMVWPVNSS
tara:strand:- start:1394 stop:1666 length:273 start_codon:yes stop_codon:yes gene_type:complete